MYRGHARSKELWRVHEHGLVGNFAHKASKDNIKQDSIFQAHYESISNQLHKDQCQHHNFCT